MAKNLFKMSPIQAYLLGKQDGAQDVWPDVFITMCYLLLPALYNTKDDKVLSDKRFAAYFQRIEQELKRILHEVLDDDPQKLFEAIQTDKTKETNEDKVNVLMTQIQALRVKLKLEDKDNE